MSYRELESFKKKVASINASIAKLEEKKAAQFQKRNEAETQRQDLLLSEALEGKEPDERQLGKLRKIIEECEQEIVEIDNRIALIEQKRKEALAPELPAIRKGHDREIENLKREAAAQFEDARKLMFEYLLALQRVGLTRQKAQSLQNDFVHHAKMVDPETYETFNRFHGAIPSPTLFYDNDGIKLGIDRQDQTSALSGSVSPIVMLYQLTGEIESDNATASVKLRKAAK